MAQVRNVSGEDRIVPELGRVVETDVVVTVPDDRLKGYTCQPAVWVEVKGAKS